MQRPLFRLEQRPLLHLSEKNRRTSGDLALGALHALYGQCLAGFISSTHTPLKASEPRM